jgi:hypothetical protein
LRCKPLRASSPGAGGGNRRGTRKAEAQPPGEIHSLVLRPGPEISAILRNFAARFMQGDCNAADAAMAILATALCDFERILAKCATVERYCVAEGIENQGDYRLSLIRAKFPKGRLPKVRIPDTGGRD